MATKKKIGLALILLVIGIGVVHGQSASALVSEYERQNRAIVDAMNRISNRSTYVQSDWDTLKNLISSYSNAYYKAQNAMRNDDYELYSDRFEACRLNYRRAFNNLKRWVNEHSDSIPKNAERIADSLDN
jgi:hypothetical protein